jgi:hypothetical protein
MLTSPHHNSISPAGNHLLKESLQPIFAAAATVMFITDIKSLREFILQRGMATPGITPKTSPAPISHNHPSSTQIDISYMQHI